MFEELSHCVTASGQSRYMSNRCQQSVRRYTRGAGGNRYLQRLWQTPLYRSQIEFLFLEEPMAIKTAAGSALGYEEWMEGEPTFTLSHDFYEFVRGRAVPINYAHLLQFVRSPRRMDLYTWLSHRTYRIGPTGIKIPLAVLQPPVRAGSLAEFMQELSPQATTRPGCDSCCASRLQSPTDA